MKIRILQQKKILGAVQKLPAKQHSQSSPIWVKMISLRTHKPEMPAHFFHLIFQLWVVCYRLWQLILLLEQRQSCMSVNFASFFVFDSKYHLSLTNMQSNRCSVVYASRLILSAFHSIFLEQAPTYFYSVFAIKCKVSFFW